MKISSLLSASAIAASTLITFSTAAFATSQIQNNSTNSELHSLQISNHSTQNEKGNTKDRQDPQRGRACNPEHPLFPFCGWW
ncbi:hypothetical protein VB774_09530 [Pseudanabaena galeata UHCC 0370]|uniref:Uncharacterized protein n=1 Tax=Pseudanabaena galeata UHCC 0370 TaxID=3110310 RepID=A0ABU5TIF2_9CYAN|nr:hypothetical protein [Pseudanabaena galeata]MEA5477861.1 hypothetical protein [Pseudanabaena galeata UHCC 0370]